MMKVPPNQRGLFPLAASVSIRLRSKDENKDQIKNRIKTNGRRLTADTSHIRFFIWIGNALKMLKLDYSCGVTGVGLKTHSKAKDKEVSDSVENNFEHTSNINGYRMLVVRLLHQQG